MHAWSLEMAVALRDVLGPCDRGEAERVVIVTDTGSSFSVDVISRAAQSQLCERLSSQAPSDARSTTKRYFTSLRSRRA